MSSSFNKYQKFVAQLLLCGFLFQNCNIDNPSIDPSTDKHKQPSRNFLNVMLQETQPYQLLLLKDIQHKSDEQRTSSNQQVSKSPVSITNFQDAKLSDIVSFPTGNIDQDNHTQKYPPSLLKRLPLEESRSTVDSTQLGFQAILQKASNHLANEISQQKNLSVRQKAAEVNRLQLLEQVVKCTFIAQGGHEIMFIYQDGNWMANVDECTPVGFSRTLKLPVRELDCKVVELLDHSTSWHSHHIHVVFPEKDAQGKGYVCLRREGGLLGGSGNKKGKERIQIREKETEQLCEAKLKDYKNLLERAIQGNDEAQFLLAQTTYNRLKGQGTNNDDLFRKVFVWLYRSAFKGYQPAVDLLLKEFGIRIHTDQPETLNFACIPSSNKHQNSCHINNEITLSMLPPFSILYDKLKGGKIEASIEELKNYCNHLFYYIDSVSAYEKFGRGPIADIMIYVRSLKEYEHTHFSTKELIQLNLKKYIQYRLHLIAIHNTLNEYIQNILKASYFNDLSLDDRIQSVSRFHTLLGYIGMENLDIITYSNDRELIQKCVKSYSDIKRQLRNDFGIPKKLLEINFLEELDKAYEIRLTAVPNLAIYFNPQPSRGVSLQKNKTSKPRVEYQQEKNRQKKVNSYLRYLQDDCPEAYSLFDAIAVQIRELDVQFSETINKELISGEAIEELTNKFLEIEQLLFSAKSSSDNKDKSVDNNLIECYEFILNLHANSALQMVNLYSFLRKGINLLVMSNNFGQALIRLQAMDCFYALRVQNPLPKNFEFSQALSYAICGQYERLSQVYQKIIQQQLEKKKRFKEKKQENLEILKKSLITQSSSEPSKPVIAKVARQRLNVASLTDPHERTNESEAAHIERQESLAQAKEDRYKRHQEAENERREKQASTTENQASSASPNKSAVVTQLQNLSVSENSLPIQFFLPKRAFNTVTQIFDHDWKITRADIENLFNELGQDINTATKSSHHIINIPSGTALVNQEGQIIGMVTGLSATLGGHLSLPNWEKEVPFYIRPQVQRILQLIGINKENYFKGNRDSHLQFVAGKSSQEESQLISSSNPAASKKCRRRNKGKVTS